MTHDEPAQRLMIAVEPRLFADALARALRRDYEVVIADMSTWSSPPAEHTHFDVAVVSDRLPPGVSVDRVLRLPESGSGTGIGVLRSGAAERTVAIGGLSAIVAVLGDPLQPTTVGE